MNVQDFLSLPPIEQQNALQVNGKKLIGYNQGGSQTEFYKLGCLFIKIILSGDGSRQVEAYVENDDSRLYGDNPDIMPTSASLLS